MFIDFFEQIVDFALLLVNWYLVFFPCFSLLPIFSNLLTSFLVFYEKSCSNKEIKEKIMSLTLVYFSLVIVFNNNIIIIYKTRFYKHYLQCRSHYHVLLTEQYLCWQCSTEYSYLQKVQLRTLQATYTANKRILIYFIVLAEYKVTYNTLYEIFTA